MISLSHAQLYFIAMVKITVRCRLVCLDTLLTREIFQGLKMNTEILMQTTMQTASVHPYPAELLE